jgi:WD40 repeat protein
MFVIPVFILYFHTKKNSGVCVKTLSGNSAEVSSVDVHQAGNQLLVATRNNTNSLYDLRMVMGILKS